MLGSVRTKNASLRGGSPRALTLNQLENGHILPGSSFYVRNARRRIAAKDHHNQRPSTSMLPMLPIHKTTVTVTTVRRAQATPPAPLLPLRRTKHRSCAFFRRSPALLRGSAVVQHRSQHQIRRPAAHRARHLAPVLLEKKTNKRKDTRPKGVTAER